MEDVEFFLFACLIYQGRIRRYAEYLPTFVLFIFTSFLSSFQSLKEKGETGNGTVRWLTEQTC